MILREGAKIIFHVDFIVNSPRNRGSNFLVFVLGRLQI